MNLPRGSLERSRASSNLKLPDIGISRTLRSKSYIVLKRTIPFKNVPNFGLRTEIAPLWIPPSSPEFHNEANAIGNLGTIGEEIRRRPRQRYVQQKLPVLNTKTCKLHGKPTDGLCPFPVIKTDLKASLDTTGNKRTHSPVAHAPPALIRIPTGRSEDPTRLKLGQINENPEGRNHRGFGGFMFNKIGEKQNITMGSLDKPPKKIATPKRYIMTWLEAGGGDPHFSERFKMQSARYRSRKQIEKLEKAAMAERAKVENNE